MRYLGSKNIVTFSNINLSASQRKIYFGFIWIYFKDCALSIFAVHDTLYAMPCAIPMSGCQDEG